MAHFLALIPPKDFQEFTLTILKIETWSKHEKVAKPFIFDYRVSDPYNFDVDPDPDPWIHILV